MNLQGPGVTGLPETLDGIRVAQEVGVNLLIYSSPLGGFFNDLPGPPAVDPEDAVIQPQCSVEGEALEAMGQAVRTGDQAGFAAFTQDIENRAPFPGTDVAGGVRLKASEMRTPVWKRVRIGSSSRLRFLP